MTTPTLATFTPRAVNLPGDLETLARQYLAHLATRRYSANTLLAYRRDLEQFVGYMTGRDVTLIQLVTTRLIEEFTDALLMGEGNSPRTVQRKRESVKGMFRFAIARGLVPQAANPCDALTPVKVVPAKRVAPDAAAIRALIEGIPADSPLGIRDRALFRLMFDAALRVGGVISLDVHDPANPPAHAVRPTGVVHYLAKGGKTKETVCDDVTLAWIARWLEARDRFARHTSPPALFLTDRGDRFTRHGILARLKLWGAKVGMPGIFNHLLRHRRIGDVLAELDLYAANYLAGHERLSTTADIYGAQAPERIRARIRNQAPVGGA